MVNRTGPIVDARIATIATNIVDLDSSKSSNCCARQFKIIPECPINFSTSHTKLTIF